VKQQFTQIITNQESGVAVIETAIVLVLLLTFFTGLVGIGLGIDSYLRFVQVAREAAMIGAKIENLTANPNAPCITTIEFFPGENRPPEVEATTATCDGGHLLMHDRANTLLSILPGVIVRATHTSTFDQVSNTVRFNLNATFQTVVPMLLVINEIPISLSIEAAKVSSGISVGLSDSLYFTELFYGGTNSGNPEVSNMGAVFNLVRAVPAS